MSWHVKTESVNYPAPQQPLFLISPQHTYTHTHFETATCVRKAELCARAQRRVKTCPLSIIQPLTMAINITPNPRHRSGPALRTHDSDTTTHPPPTTHPPGPSRARRVRHRPPGALAEKSGGCGSVYVWVGGWVGGTVHRALWQKSQVGGWVGVVCGCLCVHSHIDICTHVHTHMHTCMHTHPPTHPPTQICVKALKTSFGGKSNPEAELEG